MAKKKQTYKEKIALLSEYVPLHGYKKGRRIIKDGKVYRAKADIEEGTPWNPELWKVTKYEEYVGKTANDFLQFEYIKVIPSAWYEWHPKDDEHKEIAKTYPFRAFLSCKGVTENMCPYVLFDTSEALTGKFSNICESVKNGVYIYAKVKPTEKIYIPLVKCLKES